MKIYVVYRKNVYIITYVSFSTLQEIITRCRSGDLIWCWHTCHDPRRRSYRSRHGRRLWLIYFIFLNHHCLRGPTGEGSHSSPRGFYFFVAGHFCFRYYYYYYFFILNFLFLGNLVKRICSPRLEKRER